MSETAVNANITDILVDEYESSLKGLKSSFKLMNDGMSGFMYVISMIYYRFCYCLIYKKKKDMSKRKKKLKPNTKINQKQRSKISKRFLKNRLKKLR